MQQWCSFLLNAHSIFRMLFLWLQGLLFNSLLRTNHQFLILLFRFSSFSGLPGFFCFPAIGPCELFVAFLRMQEILVVFGFSVSVTWINEGILVCIFIIYFWFITLRVLHLFHWWLSMIFMQCFHWLLNAQLIKFFSYSLRTLDFRRLNGCAFLSRHCNQGWTCGLLLHHSFLNMWFMWFYEFLLPWISHAKEL